MLYMRTLRHREAKLTHHAAGKRQLSLERECDSVGDRKLTVNWIQEGRSDFL